MIKLIAGNSNTQLALKLANKLGVQLVHNIVTKFQDGESRVHIPEQVYNATVIIIQSTSNPANDNLIELAFMADQSKRMGARRVIAVMPYFGYSRQDRAMENQNVLSMRVVATILESAGIDHIITVDLHSLQSIGLFRIMVQNLETTSIIADIIRHDYGEQCSQLTIVSPDAGGIARARNLSARLGCSMTVINKSRDKNNACHVHEIMGNARGQHCVVVDDIIAKGDTLLQASNLLLSNGALSVSAYATHGILSDGDYQKFESSKLRRIYITDSIHRPEKLPSKFGILSIAPIIEDALSIVAAD